MSFADHVLLRPKHYIAPDRRFIPEALKKRPFWVAWRYEKVEGRDKPTKVPYQTKPGFIFERARSNDPSTWSDFETTWRIYETRKDTGICFDGIGIVLQDSDGLVGIDLDDCADPDAGTIKPEALALLALLPKTCFDLSPSSEGLRGFLLGALPEGSPKKNDEKGVEVYTHARFLTITGARLSGSLDEPAPVSPETMTTFIETVWAEKLAKEREEKRVAEERRAQARREAEEREARRACRRGAWDVDDADEIGWTPERSQRAFDRSIKSFLEAQEGDRHARLNKIAHLIGGMDAAGAVGAQAALAELESLAISVMGADRAREVRRTIRQGAESGARKPVEYTPPPKRGQSVIDKIKNAAASALVAAASVLAPTEAKAEPTQTVVVQEADDLTDEERQAKRARKIAEQIAWITLTDSTLTTAERKTLNHYVNCMRYRMGRSCTIKGCNHKSHRSFTCGREACTFCLGRVHSNLFFAREDLLEQLEASRKNREIPTENFTFEIPCPEDHKGFTKFQYSVWKKVPAKFRARVKNMTRVVRAPGLCVMETPDAVTAEQIELVTGRKPVRRERLTREGLSVETEVQRAFKRRERRIYWAIEDYARIIREAGHELVPVSKVATPLSPELARKLKAHEFRDWLKRSPVSTAGKTAARRDVLPWPGSLEVREYVRKQARTKIEEAGGNPNASPEACPSHGDHTLGPWWGKVLGQEPFVLPHQPEGGRRPPWSQVFVCAPLPNLPKGPVCDWIFAGCDAPQRE